MLWWCCESTCFFLLSFLIIDRKIFGGGIERSVRFLAVCYHTPAVRMSSSSFWIFSCDLRFFLFLQQYYDQVSQLLARWCELDNVPVVARIDGSLALLALIVCTAYYRSLAKVSTRLSLRGI